MRFKIFFGYVSFVLSVVTFSSWGYAANITLNDGVSNFSGNLRAGDPTNNVGVIFFHGRGSNYNGNFVKQVGRTLADSGAGYTTFSLSNPVPSTGTSFSSYITEEDFMGELAIARLDAAMSEMANRGIENIVFAGISLGSRFMTGAAAAWEQGLFSPSSNMNLVGLIGAGMYPETGPTTTPSNPTTLNDINFLDTKGNIALLSSTPVLDLYGSNDPRAAGNTNARRLAYGGDPTQYVQAEIDCPPDNGTYYAWLGGSSYVPYYDTTPGADRYKRCHQLRDGYLSDGNGGFIKDMTLRDSLDAPVELAITNFLENQVAEKINSVPESSTLLLMLTGLPLLFIRRKQYTADA